MSLTALGATAGQVETEARGCVEAFCKAEFQGDEKGRMDLIRITPKRAQQLRAERAGDPVRLDHVSFASDPVELVGSFVIQSLSVRGDSGRAVVDYDVLGATALSGEPSRAGEADRIVPRRRGTRHVTLHLGRGPAGDWRVLDPPIPRVSPEALLKLVRAHRHQCEETLQGVAPGESPHLERLVRILDRKIAALEELRRSGSSGPGGVPR